MTIIEKGYNTLTTVDIKTKLFEQGHIFIDGEINSETAQSVTQQILYLATTTNLPIIIHINSIGGSVTQGLLICDTIEAYADRITTIVTGEAASMGAIISIMASKRFILANSEMMLHQPLLSSNHIQGNCSSIEATSNRLIQVKKKLDKIISLKTGKSLKEVDKNTSYDHFFSAEEAVEFGLIDRIISYDEVMRGEF